MINVDQVRADVAASIGGVGAQIYTTLPGSVTTPAVVIGLPTSISLEQSYRLGVIELALTVITGPMFNSKAETELMTTALAVAAAVRAVATPTVAACRFVSIDKVTEMAVSDQVPLYSCDVNFQITTHITQE